MTENAAAANAQSGQLHCACSKNGSIQYMRNCSRLIIFGVERIETSIVAGFYMRHTPLTTELISLERSSDSFRGNAILLFHVLLFLQVGWCVRRKVNSSKRKASHHFSFSIRRSQQLTTSYSLDPFVFHIVIYLLFRPRHSISRKLRRIQFNCQATTVVGAIFKKKEETNVIAYGSLF